MKRTQSQWIGTLAIGFALVGIFAWAVFAVFGPQSSIENRLLIQIKNAESDGFSFDLRAGFTVKSESVQYQRLLLKPENTDRWNAIGTLDFEGQAGKTKIHSLGYERIAFRAEGGDWVPTLGWAPVLQEVLATLETRRIAIENHDQASLRRLTNGEPAALADPFDGMTDIHLTVRSWTIRLEPELATVREEYRLEATSKDKPIDEEGVKLLHLSFTSNSAVLMENWW